MLKSKRVLKLEADLDEANYSLRRMMDKNVELAKKLRATEELLECARKLRRPRKEKRSSPR